MSAYEDMVATAKAKSDEDVLRYIFDSLPIIATRIGFRHNSTPEEQSFGDFLWQVHRQWGEWKDGGDR